MSSDGLWVWSALFLLGAYHGINPGMGWLFAVALGMQQRARRAVGRSLPPIALGHGLAIGLAVTVAALFQKVLPLRHIQVAVALTLFGLGLYRLRRSRHPRYGGMQVGFRDLTIWSFLTASAHGAGFMVLPLLVGRVAEPTGSHHAPVNALRTPEANALAVLVHTAGYLGVTALAAYLVYEKFGLAILRKAWVNLDLIWAVALIVSGCLTLLA